MRTKIEQKNRIMNPYKICNVRVKQLGGAPFSATIIVEVEFEIESGEKVFYAIMETEGLPMLFKSKTSMYEELVALENDYDEQEKIIESENLLFECDSYEDLFQKEDEIIPELALRYLVYIVREDWDKMNEYIENTKGKYLSEIEIPPSDVDLFH